MGKTQVMLVERTQGHFEPHAVTVGQHADGYAEIRSGDKVVVGANVLIDTQSNLRAALPSFAPPLGSVRVPGLAVAAVVTGRVVAAVMSVSRVVVVGVVMVVVVSGLRM